jgi:hypothetical protein
MPFLNYRLSVTPQSQANVFLQLYRHCLLGCVAIICLLRFCVKDEYLFKSVVSQIFGAPRLSGVLFSTGVYRLDVCCGVVVVVVLVVVAVVLVVVVVVVVVA